IPQASGVGLSVLLRQSDGFEGFTWLAEGLAVDDLARPKPPQIGVATLSFDAASLAAHTRSMARHDYIGTRAPYPLDVGFELSPWLRPNKPCSLHPLDAAISLANVVRK